MKYEFVLTDKMKEDRFICDKDANVCEECSCYIGNVCIFNHLRAIEEPSGDLISRQAVLELIADYDLSMGQVVKGIHALPPVTPQQKTGYWIPLGNYDDYGNECSYKCSECGDVDTYPDNFCPNCGARMESEDKE